MEGIWWSSVPCRTWITTRLPGRPQLSIESFTPINIESFAVEEEPS
jgi:hypothetical protein